MSESSSPLRTPALVGFGLFAFASGGLGLLSGAPFLFRFDLPWAHIAAAAVSTAFAWFALQKAEGRLLAGAGLLGLVLAASATNGLPNEAGWALAVAGGVGLVVYVENAVLILRLENVARAEHGGAEGFSRGADGHGPLSADAATKAVAEQARSAQLLPVGLVAAVLVLALVLARGVFLVVDPALAASLEVGGGYGLALVSVLAAAGIWGFASARRAA